MTANSPYWWQRLIPRYGNWGGVGWSAGCWNNDPDCTDWSVAALDELDYCFKLHDLAYQTGLSWLEADTELLRSLALVRPKRVYARCYRVLAAAAFSLTSFAMTFAGDRRCRQVRTLPIDNFTTF